MTPTRSATPVLDVSELVDNATIGPLHVVVFTLCLLCLLLDGFDVQALGYAAPAIIQDWKIANAALGPVFGAANFGVLVGQLLFAMLADKIGRRPVLIGGAFFFGALTLLTARVHTVPALLGARFVAGVGLGSIIPNATALMGEYSPRRLRVTLMAIVGVGFTAGAALGGFIAAWLIPTFGWPSVFYFGGAVPLVVAALMLVWLPESLPFLVLHGRQLDRAAGWLKRIEPTARVTADTRFVVQEKQRGGLPVVHLFREGRALGTILIWIVNFMNLLNLYFLSNWLPTVVRGAGYSTSTAVLVGTTLQVGGTLGTFWLTWLVVRRGFVPVLVSCFAVASLSIALIGQPGLSLAMLVVVVFVAGSCIVGSQPTVNALSGSYYPTFLRSTGIGWGLGIGRAGAIVGPVLGGEFMALRWSTSGIFLAAAVPALVSAVVMVAMRWAMKPQRA